MTTPPEWVAEQAVDADLAARLVAGQFPSLAGARVEALAVGWDNTVFVVDGGWAFRFPRREVALPGVAREVALLPRLAPLLPLPVPVPELIGVPSADYPWPFFGARLLPGSELADAGVAPTGRVALAADLGRFLRALHDPAVAADHGAGLPVDPMRRALPAYRVPIARRWLDRLAARGTWPGDPLVEDLLGTSVDLPPSTAAPALAHGDLHLRHVLVDAAGRASGVIDWGDLCLADPCVDLSIAFSAFEGEARAALFAAYGREPGPESQMRSRVLAVVLCAALAGHADFTGSGPMLTEALAGLRRAVT